MGGTFKPTYLYLKQHNETGLKYFGKTTRDPDFYRGSGVYWTRHLNIHGNNVTTLWKKLFTDPLELKKFALEFSEKNNIVESKEYANLMVEDGFVGGDTGITEDGRKIISEKSKKYRHSKDTLQKIRDARANQTNLRTGKSQSPETIAKIKAARSQQVIVTLQVTCPHCGKTGGNRIMPRYHFDNCKEVNRVEA